MIDNETETAGEDLRAETAEAAPEVAEHDASQGRIAELEAAGRDASAALAAAAMAVRDILARDDA